MFPSFSFLLSSSRQRNRANIFVSPFLLMTLLDLNSMTMVRRRRINESSVGATLKGIPFWTISTLVILSMPSSAISWHALVQHYIQVKIWFMKTSDNRTILHFLRLFIFPYLPLHTKQTEYQEHFQ